MLVPPPVPSVSRRTFPYPRTSFLCTLLCLDLRFSGSFFASSECQSGKYERDFVFFCLLSTLGNVLLLSCDILKINYSNKLLHFIM